MTDHTEDAHALVAAVDGELQLVQEYAGGQGRSLRVRDGAGRDLLLKVLAAGEVPVEAQLVGAVRHPRIPTVIGVGQLADGRGYVLRQHVEGEVLASLPAQAEALRPLLMQLLEVTSFVHQRGVLHLDLKPSNLVVDRDGHLHMLDFGLAVRGGAASRGGTPFFAAPEVLFGAATDPRADLFSIGAMVVLALAPSARQRLDRFVRRFPSASFLVACGVEEADLPSPFGAFVRRCVARRPQDRFPDVDAALEQLSGTGAGRPSLASLRPDPAVLFAPELAAVGDATGDVCIEGGEAADRQAIALQLSVSLGAVRSIATEAQQVRLRRGGAGVVTVRLPALDRARLAPHLQAVFALDEAAAGRAADALLRDGRSTAHVVSRLAQLAEAGELLAAGTRWTWPGARSGRMEAQASPAAHDVSAEERVRHLAARGRFEPARAIWRAATGDEELALRAALVEGMLDAGEPARALPLTADLPELRAQALVETGQFALAARELARLGAPRRGRHRRVAAQLALATGDLARARALFDGPLEDASDRLLFAAVLERCGELDACEAELARSLAELDVERWPFGFASLQTIHGHVCRQRGDLDGARAHFERAVRAALDLGHLRHAATAQLNLGVVAKDARDHVAAAARFREALALFEHVGDRARAAIAGANLGIAAFARGDAEAARDALVPASRRLAELGDVGAAQLATVTLARAHVRCGDAVAAAALLASLGPPEGARMVAEVEEARRELRAGRVRGDDGRMSVQEGDGGPSREMFRTFLAVNRKLAQATALEEAMTGLLDAATTLTGGRSGYLLVMGEDGVRKEFQSGHTGTHAQAFSRSLAHRAIEQQRTLTGADVLADVELQQMQSVRNLRVRSAMCAPFRSAGGIRGAIYVEHPGRAGVFTDLDLEAMEVLADQAAIAVDRMQREAAMQRELQTTRQQLQVSDRARRRARVELIGSSAAMQALRDEIGRLADAELAVLVLGETGTGKELVARALHERGVRAGGPFVAENCSALPAELMERELFGHVEGAFTGADRARPGLLELASGGTLFLDEVGDMPAELQAKLLRALQERVIRRVGGSEWIELDLRLVSATHKDLRQMVGDGAFREDLFYRLAAVEVQVPPLRARGGDVIELAEHFVRIGDGPRRLSGPVRDALSAYAWPGNVRELEHVLARAALLCDGVEIVSVDLPRQPRGGLETTADEVVTLKEAERRAIVAALQACGGDKAKAARRLGVSRTAIYDKIKRHGLASE